MYFVQNFMVIPTPLFILPYLPSFGVKSPVCEPNSLDFFGLFFAVLHFFSVLTFCIWVLKVQNMLNVTWHHLINETKWKKTKSGAKFSHFFEICIFWIFFGFFWIISICHLCRLFSLRVFNLQGMTIPPIDRKFYAD